MPETHIPFALAVAGQIREKVIAIGLSVRDIVILTSILGVLGTLFGVLQWRLDEMSVMLEATHKTMIREAEIADNDVLQAAKTHADLSREKKFDTDDIVSRDVAIQALVDKMDVFNREFAEANAILREYRIRTRDLADNLAESDSLFAVLQATTGKLAQTVHDMKTLLSKVEQWQRDVRQTLPAFNERIKTLEIYRDRGVHGP